MTFVSCKHNEFFDIQIGNIPIGYSFDAVNESNKTHQLPVPPNAKGDTNYALIMERINEFIGNMAEFIPLFTTEENIPMIESLIEEFSIAANINGNMYKILPLDQLYFDLKEQTAIRSIEGTRGFTCVGEATDQLNLDKYMYFKNIGCQVSQIVLFIKSIICRVPNDFAMSL